jgi:hypothetical protein
MGVSFSRIRPLLQITNESLSLDIVVGQAVVRLQRAGEATVFQTAQALEKLLSKTTLLSELFRYFSEEAFAEIDSDGWRLEIGTHAACATLQISSDEADSIMRYVTAECRSILQSVGESETVGDNDDNAGEFAAASAAAFAAASAADGADEPVAPANSEVGELAVDSDSETFADPPPPMSDAAEVDWNTNFERLRDHVSLTGGLTQMEPHLYKWCHNQKIAYWRLQASRACGRDVSGMLSAARIALLTEIPGWNWEATAGGAQPNELKETTFADILHIWRTMFGALQQHVAQTGSLANMPPELYEWCQNISAAFRNLNDEQIISLNRIPQWDWAKPAGGATVAPHQPAADPHLMNYSRAPQLLSVADDNVF